MEDDMCPGCAEEMAHYAGILAQLGEMDEDDGTDRTSPLIMGDIAKYWTPEDTRWLLLMTSIISKERATAAMRSQPLFPWFRKKGRHAR